MELDERSRLISKAEDLLGGTQIQAGLGALTTDAAVIESGGRRARVAAALTAASVDGLILTQWNPWNLFFFHLHRHFLFRSVLVLADLLLLLLSLCEYPVIFVVPQSLVVAIELICVAVIILEFMLVVCFIHIRKLLEDFGRIIVACFVFVVIAHALLSIAFPHSMLLSLTRVVRPFFLIYHVHALRRSFLSVILTLREVVTLVGLLFFSIFLFALVGMVIFVGTPEEDMYFSSLFDAYLNLVVLLTTANYPDVMMPAYNYSRWNVIYFVLFLCFGVYFLLNVVTGSIYTSCKNFLQRSWQMQYFHRHVAARMSFSILKYGYVYTVEDGESLPLEAVTQYLRSLGVSDKESQIYWEVCGMDQEADTPVSFEQFLVCADLVMLDIRPGSAFSFSCVHAYLNLPPIVFLRRLVTHKVFELMVDALIILNVIIMAAQIIWDPQSFADSSILWLRIVGYGFTWAFVAEFYLKLAALGPVAYFQNNWNKFDAFLVWFTVLTDVALLYFTSIVFARVLLLFRVLRLARFFSRLEWSRKLLGSLAQVRVQLLIFLGHMLAVYYIFALVGMFFFADAIHLPRDARLEGTAYDTLGYYPNNFNDICASFVTLWELMVVNNWYVIMDAYMVVTSRVAVLFFVSWYILSVVFALNVVVAGFLDAFDSQWSETKASMDDSEEGHLSAKRNLLNAIQTMEKLLNTVPRQQEDIGYQWSWQSHASMGLLTRLINCEIEPPSSEVINRFIEHALMATGSPQFGSDASDNE